MLALFASALIAAQAPAAQDRPAGVDPSWIEVGSNGERRGFIDPQAVGREGSRVRVRGRIILTRPDQHGTQILDYQNELDCAARSWRIVSFVASGANGNVTERHTAEANAPFEKIRPGSNGAELESRFCR
jgi:hypothetical protein